jgi:hypothetical protein
MAALPGPPDCARRARRIASVAATWLALALMLASSALAEDPAGLRVRVGTLHLDVPVEGLPLVDGLGVAAPRLGVEVGYEAGGASALDTASVGSAAAPAPGGEAGADAGPGDAMAASPTPANPLLGWLVLAGLLFLAVLAGVAVAQGSQRRRARAEREADLAAALREERAERAAKRAAAEQAAREAAARQAAAKVPASASVPAPARPAPAAAARAGPSAAVGRVSLAPAAATAA